MVGQMPRPQLLRVVTWKLTTEVHLLGLGRRRMERYTPEPDLCRHCSRWGQKECRCQFAPRCSSNKSVQCLDKIKEGTKIPPRCCNCGCDHNAHSTLCTVDGLKTQMQHHHNERSFLSDHFALETTLPVQSALAVPRKRLTVPPSRIAGLVVHVVTWYSAMWGSFIDAEVLCDGLLHTIEGFITPATYQRRWQLNPADTESRDAMVTMARHLTDLQQQERKKY
ncbi:hypothetical protein E2C01_047621 [Portunus trituberculatus]|uniref:Uncharacterized protein n=1 Tax=Portunus trituberculatus TaxID=210409 RepID=A0A5B7G442_PORTR|nr:hypothetical protein [Portunus trituberculatus]